MTSRAWRRTLVSRLLYPRTPRRRPRAMGVCLACGVTFIALRGRDEQTAETVSVHETICPGGDADR